MISISQPQRCIRFIGKKTFSILFYSRKNYVKYQLEIYSSWNKFMLIERTMTLANDTEFKHFEYLDLRVYARFCWKDLNLTINENIYLTIVFPEINIVIWCSVWMCKVLIKCSEFSRNMTVVLSCERNISVKITERHKSGIVELRKVSMDYWIKNIMFLETQWKYINKNWYIGE